MDRLFKTKTEADYLRSGFTPIPKGTRVIRKILSNSANRFIKFVAKYPPVEPDVQLDDNYNLDSFGVKATIIHTPGHTIGSLCIILDEKRIIVGDTVVNHLIDGVYPPYADDEIALLKSWDRIEKTGCEYFYPGHGKPFQKKTFMKTYLKYKK